MIIRMIVIIVVIKIIKKEIFAKRAISEGRIRYIAAIMLTVPSLVENEKALL